MIDSDGPYSRGAKWTILQMQLLPVCPFRLFNEQTPTYGLALNLWGNLWDSYGDNYGFVLNGYAEGSHNYGMGIGVYQKFKQNSGLAMGVFNGVSFRNRGLQIGAVNFCRNHYSNSRFPNGNTGVQLGFVNLCDQIRKLIPQPPPPEEAPVENTLQIGLWNQANAGWQLGLINYNRQSNFPWMIFCNYSQPLRP